VELPDGGYLPKQRQGSERPAVRTAVRYRTIGTRRGTLRVDADAASGKGTTAGARVAPSIDIVTILVLTIIAALLAASWRRRDRQGSQRMRPVARR
jgi:hypothetical protein